LPERLPPSRRAILAGHLGESLVIVAATIRLLRRDALSTWWRDAAWVHYSCIDDAGHG